MKITGINYEKVRLKLEKPFVVAIGTIEYAEIIIVKITTDEGIIGYGEASPFAPVTGETIDSVPVALELFKPVLMGKNPFELEMIHKTMDRLIVGSSSAKAAIDIAIHDIISKKAEIPLYKYLGGYSNSFVTDMTVGIDKPGEMAKEALRYVKEGFKIIKVKAGVSADDDIKTMELIRKTVGEGITLRVDANQGWSVNTAIRIIREYEKYGVESVEQPVVYWDIEGLAYIRRHSNISIMADESLHTPQDAMKLARLSAVDIFNIKLMKSSGLYPAMRINAIGESCGVSCMLGCMLESRISITAAASLIAAQKNVTKADLDSYRHFGDDIISGGFSVKDGIITLSEEPGLGIELNL